ncbi:MAG: riboflavin synthase [Candidatus Levybacteria bacterium]|nr:riboflavin synthase [Candidatus Levybacteria bacterium]
MFTGIINNLGELNKKENNIFSFYADESFCRKLKTGESVAVNGVCLTVYAMPTKQSFSVEIMPETKKRTMLDNLKVNNLVNLELPATLSTFLSGHLVQGHVDGVGRVEKIEKVENSRLLKIQISKEITQYIVEKGSIAVNGISLTVVDAAFDYFTVSIIPFTWENTMLHTINMGDLINIEVDVLAKYVEKIYKGAGK